MLCILPQDTQGEENNGLPAGSGDRKLLTGYLDTNDGDGVATVTVSGIPNEYTSGGYDVLVYCVGGVPGRGGAYTIGGETKFGTDGANTPAQVEDPGANVNDTHLAVVAPAHLTRTAFEFLGKRPLPRVIALRPVVYVLGPSGSGKTSVARRLAEGAVELDGAQLRQALVHAVRNGVFPS